MLPAAAGPDVVQAILTRNPNVGKPVRPCATLGAVPHSAAIGEHAAMRPCIVDIGAPRARAAAGNAERASHLWQIVCDAPAAGEWRRSRLGVSLERWVQSRGGE